MDPDCLSSTLCSACNQAVLACDVADHADVCLAANREPQRSREWIEAVGVASAITVKRLGISEVWHLVIEFLCPAWWWEEFMIVCPHADKRTPCVWRGWRTDLYDHMRLFHDEVTCETCRLPLSRLELREHCCRIFEQDYEVVCHACGETVLRSDITSGSHADSCQVSACLVVHTGNRNFGRAGCHIRCGETRFTSTSNLCMQLWRHQLDYEMLRNNCEVLQEEKSVEQAATLALRAELEGCKRRLELAANSDVSKENAMLRTALMNEWKQFRSLEREFLGRSSAFMCTLPDNDSYLFEADTNLSFEESPLDTSALQPQFEADTNLSFERAPLDNSALQPQLSLLEEGIADLTEPLLRVETPSESNFGEELKALEAKLNHTVYMLENKTKELDDCKLERKFLRGLLLCTVLLCMMLAYFLFRCLKASHLTCMQ